MLVCDRAVFAPLMMCMQTTSPLVLTHGVGVNCVLPLYILRQICVDWSAR